MQMAIHLPKTLHVLVVEPVKNLEDYDINDEDPAIYSNGGDQYVSQGWSNGQTFSCLPGQPFLSLRICLNQFLCQPC